MSNKGSVNRDLDVKTIPIVISRQTSEFRTPQRQSTFSTNSTNNLCIEHANVSEPLPVALVATGPLTMCLANLLGDATSTRPVNVSGDAIGSTVRREWGGAHQRKIRPFAETAK